MATVVDQVLLVRDSEIRQTRAGADFMRLSLADRTGVVAGVVWEDVYQASVTARVGEPVRVKGQFSCDQGYGRQVTIRALEDAVDVDWTPCSTARAHPLPSLDGNSMRCFRASTIRNLRR